MVVPPLHFEVANQQCVADVAGTVYGVAGTILTVNKDKRQLAVVILLVDLATPLS
jgi:hypothetical protein